jgi:type II secretory pathway pseudopilin PulG
MIEPKYCNLMHLQGQRSRRGEAGYAMAALLVALAVMGVLMTAAIPAWRQQAKREKEAELVFRGEQYARAIGLWERKMGPGSRPPNFDVLVQQRFLRKKYKDPMTEDGEFQPVLLGAINQNPIQNPEGIRGRGGRGGIGGPGVGVSGAGPSGRASGPPGGASGPSGASAQASTQTSSRLGQGSSRFQTSQFQTAGAAGGQFAGAGGLVGVRSKSKETSIRLYKGRNHYNEWEFIHAGASNMPGGGVGSQVPGGRGGAPRPGMPGRGGPGTGPGRGPGGPGIGPGRGQPPAPAPPGAGRGRGPGT